MAETINKKASKKETWNLEAFFPTLEEWERKIDSTHLKAKSGWDQLQGYKGKIATGTPALLKELLQNYFASSRDIEKIYTYAHLKHDENITDDLFKSGFERSVALYQMFSSAASWIEPEILQIPTEKLEKLMKDPELSEYKFYLRCLIDQKEHVLDGDKEQILSLMSQTQRTPQVAFSALSNADLRFPKVKGSEGVEHELTHGTYSVLMKSYDRTLRENAFKGMHATFQNFENTLTALVAGQVQNHLFTMKVRGYSTCVEAALKRYQIPIEVYKNLIATTRKRIEALHRYVRLRKKVLGLDQIHFWDLSVPMVKDIDMKFSYENACDITINSVALLGKEYQEILRKGITEDRWVDVYESKGKRSGAYSSGCYDSMPYILLNYQGRLNDLMTLSHEAGHSMNTLLSNRKQAYHEASYPIFVAEVASTFHEQLTAEYLMDHAKTKQERIYLLNQEIDSIRGTFFRQTMFAEFELKIHEIVEQDQPLTKELLKKIYADLNRDYFGPDLVIDPELSVEFMRVPHFYYNFYVYQYATGIAAARALVEDVKTRGNKDYLNFLASGGSDYPIPTLKRAGVDMKSPVAIESLITHFEDLVKKLEKEIV